MLAFLPMVGFHIGNATLVGQSIGGGRPEEGVYATTSALHITLAYMTVLAAVFVLAPGPLLSLFKVNSLNPAHHGDIMALGAILMRFVAVFCFFDALNLIFSGAIKGAGDTRFIMWTIAALTLGVMIGPTYVAVEVIGAGVYTVWTLAACYACSLGVAFMLRYRHGKWKTMRVIEGHAVVDEMGSRGA
jgi:MATE family multidrug resistance protein